MFQQGIFITIETVLRNLKLHGTTIKCYPLASCLYQMGHGIIGTHIVIDHHTTGIHARTDSVIEHDGDTCINQPLIVFVVLGVLRLRHDDTTDLVTMEVLTDPHLTFMLLPTQGHHDPITTGGCSLLNACQDRREIIVRELRYDDTDDSLRHYPTVA